MKKILYSIIISGALIGCGQKNDVKSSGNPTGDTKTKKQDSVSAQNFDTTKIDVSSLPKFKMTFEREGGVDIINSDLSSERFLFNGHDNLISPDGSKVVTTVTNQDGSRNIAIYEIASKTQKILKSPTGRQSFDASFSPDGKTLVFCNFSGAKWNIALVNVDDTGFKILSVSYKTDLFCPTFSADGASILCQDMMNFIEFDLKGNIVKTTPVKEIIGDRKMYMSSANKGYLINNKTEILFDADTEDFFETAREPISNIYIYNLQTKKLRNLSDKNISAYDPFPLSDGKHILFSAFTKEDLSKSSDPKDMEPVITSWVYLMNIDGGGKTRLVKNAFEPSASKLD
jgi:WD40 repeat protein